MKTRYMLQARYDRRAIVRYLQDNSRPEIAIRFIAELERCIAGIVERPLAWPHVGGSETERWKPLASLPYYVAYAIRDRTIVILAIGNQRGERGYWR